jgi:hypothetical protein
MLAAGAIFHVSRTRNPKHYGVTQEPIRNKHDDCARADQPLDYA